jgi:hypothetical protein
VVALGTNVLHFNLLMLLLLMRKEEFWRDVLGGVSLDVTMLSLINNSSVVLIDDNWFIRIMR